MQGKQYQHQGITIYNTDCLPAMKQMKDDEFNLAIVDPPYMDIFNTDSWGGTAGKQKAHKEAIINGGTKVCLIPVRSNTKWWAETMPDAEIRFINGEVNFNDEPRGLWMGMCIVVFGEQAKVGTHSIIDYRKARVKFKK